MATHSLSGLHSFVAAFHSEPFWIGIDVHKRSYHLALLRADGKTFTLVVPAIPAKLVEQLEDLAIHIAGVSYEAGPTGFSLARALQAAKISVVVAAPSKVPRSIRAGSKTDRLDCLKLAHFVAKGLIRPIAIPTEHEEAHRALLRRRHQLVDGIRRSKQRIKGFLLYHGFQESGAVKNWRSDMPREIASLPLEAEGRLTIESHLRELSFLQDELSSVTMQLDQINLKQEHRATIRALTSVPGVGKIVATTFHTELFRPERFKRSEEVTSYLGLAPTVRHSGEKTPRGYLAPVGQTRLRSLLIEAAWLWRAKDPYARDIYTKLLSRTGIPQKAIAALARRLAIILWRLSIEQRAYRPVNL
jgi:transposase